MKKLICLLITVAFLLTLSNMVMEANARLSNAVLDGEYVLVQLGFENLDGEPNPLSKRILLEFDGQGGYVATILLEESTITTRDTGTYSVSPSGELTLSGWTSVGQVTPDGQMFFLVDTDTADDALDIAVGLRKFEESEEPTGSIQGSHIMTLMSVEEDGLIFNARILMDFDVDTVNLKILNASRAEIVDFEDTRDYQVGNDGTLSITDSGIGQVSLNGNMFILKNPDEGSTSVIAFGLKKSQGMSNASLKGRYIGGQIAYMEDPDPLYETQRFMVVADGQGGFRVRDRAWSHGEPEGEGQGWYEIGDDGTFFLCIDDPEECFEVGIISSDGTVFTFISTDIEDEEPLDISIAFGVIRSGVPAMPGTYLLLE